VPILGHGGGRLVYLGTSVDLKTRTVALVYEVPNPDGRLRIGMALTVSVETAHMEEALVVPVAALVDEDGRAIAFVQVSGETFEKRDLTLGIRDGAFVQVLAGLAAGERVVTQGAYAIRLASVSTTIPAHGHAH
jgi:cobalt-zinc-cadmium efflux system membrane fusion protein